MEWCAEIKIDFSDCISVMKLEKTLTAQPLTEKRQIK
jgi:hypothetical protein